MDFLLSRYEAATKEFKNNRLILPCLCTGWEKLAKYYHLSDQMPVYIAAIVLYSELKFAYLDRHWEKKWAIEARTKMRSFWNTQYKSTAIELHPQLCSETSAESVNEFEAWFHTDRLTSKDIDELEHYLAQSVVPDLLRSACQWWLEPSQCQMYPNLFRMAIELLSIPAMSAEPERLFSGAKLTISDQRASLQAQTIEATECLKSWFRRVE